MAPEPVRAALARFVLPIGGAREAAAALAAHLAAAGLDAKIASTLTPLDLHVVTVDAEPERVHVLVVTGELPRVRDRVRLLLQLPLPGGLALVSPLADLPPDLAFVFSDRPLAALDRALRWDRALPGDLRMSAVPRAVAELVPRLEAASGEPLRGAPDEVLAAVDRIVLAARGVEPDRHLAPESVLPPTLACLLGLVATEAVRDAIGGGRLAVPDTEGAANPTLGDARGFPVVWTGNAQLAIGQKVVKQWFHGREDSVAFLLATARRMLAEHPPAHLPPREVPAEVAPPTEPVSDTRTLERAAYGVIAGFMMVASADGSVDPAETDAFVRGIDGGPTVLRQVLLASRANAGRRVARLVAEPALVPHVLGALGTVLRTHPDGAEGLAAYRQALAAVAAADGVVGSTEAVALASVDALLAATPDAPPPDLGEPLDDAPADGEPPSRDAALALSASFLAIAAQDGDVDQRELATYRDALRDARNPLLRQLASMDRAAAPVAAPLDAARSREVLLAANRLFRIHPLGDGARTELLELLGRVAAAGEGPRERERAALARLGRDLSRRPAGRAVFGGAAVLAGLVFAWQVASLAFDLEAVFVPVAIGLQVGVTTLAARAWRGSFGERVSSGVLLAAVASVGIATTAIGVALVGGLGASAAIGGAVAGGVGTLVTGVVLALALGALLREPG